MQQSTWVSNTVLHFCMLKFKQLTNFSVYRTNLHIQSRELNWSRLFATILTQQNTTEIENELTKKFISRTYAYLY